MSAQGILVQPTLGGGPVWDLTWQKLDRALPKLRPEIFPGEMKSTKDYFDSKNQAEGSEPKKEGE